MTYDLSFGRVPGFRLRIADLINIGHSALSQKMRLVAAIG